MRPGIMTFEIKENILSGPALEYPEDWSSLGEFVWDKLTKDPDFRGQLDIESGTKNTYKDMKERSIRCAVWMKSKGVKAGDIIALYSVNHWDVAPVCFATLWLGAIFHPIESRLTEEQVCEVVKVTKPKMVFASQRSALRFEDAVKDAELNIRIISYGSIPGFDDFRTVQAQATEDDVEDFEIEEVASLDETAFIMCTTNANDVTKIYTLDHRTVFRDMYTSKMFNFEGDKFLTFSHIPSRTGLLYVFASIMAKKTRYITMPFDPRICCKAMEKYKNEMVHMTSHACEAVIRLGWHRKFDISGVKRVVCGGGRTPVDFHKKIARAIPHVEIFYGFGMPEEVGLATMPCINLRPGAAGRISENSQVKVVDPKTGQLLEKNQQGEVCVKSPSVIKSYYMNPEADAASFDDKGWFRTGELGYFDDNGEVFLVGRFDEMITYQDTQINPRPIEVVLMNQPGVLDCAVVGVPHPTDGEHPIAFVVKTEDAEITEKDLIEIVASKIPEAKGLPGGLEIIKAIPRTAEELIRRAELRNMAKSIKERENL